MDEVARLLEDVEAGGGRVVVRADGSPAVRGRVPPEVMARLRQMRAAVVDRLNGPRRRVVDALTGVVLREWREPNDGAALAYMRETAFREGRALALEHRPPAGHLWTRYAETLPGGAA